MLFEDFEVGQRYVLGPRSVPPEDLVAFTMISQRGLIGEGPDGPGKPDTKSTLHTSYGAVVAATMWADLGLTDESFIRTLKETWHYYRPIIVGDELTLTATITKMKPGRDGASGTVTRFSELSNADGRVVQCGTATALIRSDGSARRATNRDVGTNAWAEELASQLRGNKAFRSAADSWDGTIGLRAGEDEVHLRIYRGQIIDVTSRAPHGSTFTFGATHRTWTDLLTGPPDQFARRLLAGDFEVTGDRYEYLRLTKTLEIIVETARAMALSQRVGSPS